MLCCGDDCDSLAAARPRVIMCPAPVSAPSLPRPATPPRHTAAVTDPIHTGEYGNTFPPCRVADTADTAAISWDLNCAMSTLYTVMFLVMVMSSPRPSRGARRAERRLCAGSWCRGCSSAGPGQPAPCCRGPPRTAAPASPRLGGTKLSRNFC